ncbi:PREDICTED: uncharacterized protein LOC104593643 [Nelumbo nucifera]|uniref:Uncharacterized protein LOC104593643 n=1 Tax=Nelumbo nucifera TaxID=4432 RepID=A0A1U7ZSS4_NELNU|nr:PREDICTED: uncharacterized protein LOC104593643 [Nelumbo nucifera]
MGKVEEEQALHSTVVEGIPEENVGSRCEIKKYVGLRCVVVVLFSIAVLLSGVFWLPPFFRYGKHGDLDLDAQIRDHDVVASFKLEKSVSLLNANILELEHNIIDEIGVADSKVVVISLKSLAGSNSTDVVFAVVPYLENLNISSPALSLLRSVFEELVIDQTPLHLNSSLFGDPFSFEVLKFQGGITVTPQQNAFLLQRVQIFFNFTLNFSIDQIQEYFIELKKQLKSGLHLTSHENLYVSLTNMNGSTVKPPTIVKASVLPAIGKLPLPRLKQLAQTITGSPAKNLGLNNTVFGRVKQVRLSSVLEHSLNGSGGSNSVASSPSPAPLPRVHHHHHHHHHHHYPQNHHQNVHLAPAPAPVPATDNNHWAKPPSGCQNRSIIKAKRQPHLVPTNAPLVPPHHSSSSPVFHVDPPAPALHQLPGSAPLPAVVFAHVHPPSKSIVDVEPPDIMPSPPDIMPSISPLPPSSTAALPPVQSAIALVLSLVMHFL